MDYLRALGISVDIEEPEAPAGPELFADTVDSFAAFCALWSCWRWIGTMAGAHCVGMDWAQARALLEMRGDEISVDLVEDLQLMEREAVSALNGAANG